jgi:hypothetical protein
VLYGLRFEDGVSFVCWPDPGPPPRDDEGLQIDAWDFRLNDNLGTSYGGPHAWGNADGVQGVSFAAERSGNAPSWVELVSRQGNTLRLPV